MTLTEINELEIYQRFARLSCIPAVYFLFEGDDLVYVGQTVNLRSRIEQHKENGIIPFNTFRYVKINDAPERMIFEHQHIKEFNPRYNRTNITDAKARLYEKCISERDNKEIHHGERDLSFFAEQGFDVLQFNMYGLNGFTAHKLRIRIAVLFNLITYTVHDNNEFGVTSGSMSSICESIGLYGEYGNRETYMIKEVSEAIDELCESGLIEEIGEGLYRVSYNLLTRHGNCSTAYWEEDAELGRRMARDKRQHK